MTTQKNGFTKTVISENLSNRAFYEYAAAQGALSIGVFSGYGGEYFESAGITINEAGITLWHQITEGIGAVNFGKP